MILLCAICHIAAVVVVVAVIYWKISNISIIRFERKFYKIRNSTPAAASAQYDFIKVEFLHFVSMMGFSFDVK